MTSATAHRQVEKVRCPTFSQRVTSSLTSSLTSKFVVRDPRPLLGRQHIQMMAETEGRKAIPTPEKVLRDLAKNAFNAIPQFEEKEPIAGVK